MSEFLQKFFWYFISGLRGN